MGVELKDERIPVTILTGFLGAGKTTLLNNIIQSNKAKKLAVIENEVGDINIDSSLVLGMEDGIFELSGGCICCKLNDELGKIIHKLLEQHPTLDHLLVETTGIADPGPVALSFLTDEEIQVSFRLDAIITLVDTSRIEQQLEDTEEACKQIALADVIVLNKIDKTDDYQKDTVRNIIKRINSEALLVESEFGKVEGVNLLSTNSFAAYKPFKYTLEEAPKNLSTIRSSLLPLLSKGNSLEGSQLKKIRHSEISSISLVFKDALDPIKFNIWMRVMLHLSSCKILRAKGIVQFADVDEKILFQAVHTEFMCESFGSWEEGERVSKMVFIGKNLTKEIVVKGLEECVMHSSDNLVS